MATRVKCDWCDNMILEATAKRNRGLCGVCVKDRNKADLDKTVQGWIDNPETLPGTNGIPEPEDIALAIAARHVKSRLFPDENDRMENFCHDFFDAAHTKWSELGSSALTEKEKHALAVETFYGEVTNGGLVQYLGNESGAFANWSVDAFEAIGISDFAHVMRDVKALFPESVIPDDPGERWDIVETIDEERLEALEEGFWTRYFADKSEIRKKLFEYLST